MKLGVTILKRRTGETVATLGLESMEGLRSLANWVLDNVNLVNDDQRQREFAKKLDVGSDSGCATDH